MFLGNCVTDLCYICIGNRECRRCRRRLPGRLFQDDNDLCRACRNIDPSHIGRYTLGGFVEEHEFLGNNGDVSVDDFVRRHADAVTSTFNEAKNKHMYVLFCLLLKFLRNFYLVVSRYTIDDCLAHVFNLFVLVPSSTTSGQTSSSNAKCPTPTNCSTRPRVSICRP